MNFKRGHDSISISYEIGSGPWVVLTIWPPANKKTSNDYFFNKLMRVRNPEVSYPNLKDSVENLATREQFDEYMKRIASLLENYFLDFLRGSNDLGSVYLAEFK
ncbi:hypothetical protein OAU50_07825 [Planctomycetota bacterium]|nr:hypothetical protein [Planctomycetota bacterium]